MALKQSNSTNSLRPQDKYEKVKGYYEQYLEWLAELVTRPDAPKRGWSKGQVWDSVGKAWITTAQYEEIVNEPYPSERPE